MSMLKMKKKITAFMHTKQSNKGFTFVSMLFALMVISMTLPLLTAFLKSISFSASYDLTSVQHFFYFLRNDLLKAVSFFVNNNNQLYFELNTGEIVIIEQYGSLIRKQVDGKGHEVYLRDVKNFSLKDLSYGIKVTVETIQGDAYEKTIVFY